MRAYVLVSRDVVSQLDLMLYGSSWNISKWFLADGVFIVSSQLSLSNLHGGEGNAGKPFLFQPSRGYVFLAVQAQMSTVYGSWSGQQIVFFRGEVDGTILPAIIACDTLMSWLQ